ncbi:MAG: hypothetical protein ACKODH_16175 [Limisphaerales bacterium]
MELDDLTVGIAQPAPAKKERPVRREKPAPVAPAAAPPVTEPKPRAHYTGQTSSYDPDVLRSSIYWHRAVHDVLREIAYSDRKSISGLIMEGLDKVLVEYGRPDTKTLIAEFREKKAR